MCESLPDDLIGAYVRSISRWPLLTAAEEMQLGQSIATYREIENRRLPDMTDEDLACQEGYTSDELNSLRHSYKSSKDRFIKSNLRLVFKIAKGYSKGEGAPPLLDLVQEGTLGLIRAVDKFDFTRGLKFSTYATWWIRQFISRSLPELTRVIRLPVHMVELTNKIKKTQRLLTQSLERDITIDEVAESLKIPREKVDNALRVSKDPIYLGDPVSETDGQPLENYVTTIPETPPKDVTFDEELRNILSSMLERLDAREREIIIHRYGLDSGQEMTLADVGKLYNLTRERIRQIEIKALNKLRGQEFIRPQLIDFIS